MKISNSPVNLKDMKKNKKMKKIAKIIFRMKIHNTFCDLKRLDAEAKNQLIYEQCASHSVFNRQMYTYYIVNIIQLMMQRQ